MSQKGLYNIQGLYSNFIGCESSLKSKSSDILSSYEINLEDSIVSNNLSVRGCLPLIWKNSITNMHDHSLCEGGASFCMGVILRIVC